MGPSPHLAWASPDCQPLGELPLGKGQDGEEQLRSPAERTSLNTAPPPHLQHKSAPWRWPLASCFLFSTQAILERPQILWLRHGVASVVGEACLEGICPPSPTLNTL